LKKSGSEARTSGKILQGCCTRHFSAFRKPSEIVNKTSLFRRMAASGKLAQLSRHIKTSADSSRGLNCSSFTRCYCIRIVIQPRPEAVSPYLAV
jgi:hypothetical protein